MSLMTFCFAGVCLNSEAKVNLGIEAKVGFASLNVKKMDIKETPELKKLKNAAGADIERAASVAALPDIAGAAGAGLTADERKEQFKKIYEYDVYSPSVFKYSNGVNKQNNSFAVTVAGSANVELGSDFELGGKVYYTYLAGGKTKIQSTKVGYKADGTVNDTHYDIVVPIASVHHDDNVAVNPPFVNGATYKVTLPGTGTIISTTQAYAKGTKSSFCAFLVYNPVTGTSKFATVRGEDNVDIVANVINSALIQKDEIENLGGQNMRTINNPDEFTENSHKYLGDDGRVVDDDHALTNDDVLMMYDAEGTMETAAGNDFKLGTVRIDGDDKNEFTLDEINAMDPKFKEFILKAKEKYAEVLKYNGGAHFVDETLRVRGMYGFMIDASYKINDKAKVFVGAGFGIPVIKSDTKLKKKLGFAAEFGVSAEVCPSVSIGATYNYNKINLKAKHEEIDKLRKLKGNLHIFSLTFTKTF